MARGRRGRPPGATARAFQACEVIYAELERRSVSLAEAPNDLVALVPDGAVRLFVGSLIRLLRDLGMTSLETYHSRKSELVDMGCIAQVRAGKRYVPGCWALLAEPTVERWDAQVARPFSHKREVEVRELHQAHLTSFLEAAPTLFPRLLREAHATGCRTGADLLRYLAGLPERRLRALHPLCLGYAVPGTVHTCGIEPLDPTVPSRAAGAWKRRRDHLAKLAEAT
jgi:hypothetical protein